MSNYEESFEEKVREVIDSYQIQDKMTEQNKFILVVDTKIEQYQKNLDEWIGTIKTKDNQIEA